MAIYTLGTFAVSRSGAATAPSAPKQRQLLALFAMRANRLVPYSDLMYELWRERPPRSSAATMQTYMAKIRRFLAEVLQRPLAEIIDHVLTTDQGGYTLHWNPDELDYHRFERTVAAGRAALAAGRTEQAAGLLGDALRLWHGAALDGVHHGPLLEIQSRRLEALKLAATEQRYDLDLRLGRHYEVVADLIELTDQNPLDESLHALVMTALVRTGRRFEALRIYEGIRRRLALETGLEPSAEINALRRRLLAAPDAASGEQPRGETQPPDGLRQLAAAKVPRRG